MTSNAPWSVKGIDPKTREAAKEFARQSGMTLGEWLNQRIREQASAIPAPAPEVIPINPQAAVPPPMAASPAADSLAELSRKIDAAEQRSTLAVTGLDQSVRGVLARIELSERDQADARAKIEARLLKVEEDGAGPRSAEALRSLEAAFGKVAHRANDAEARMADSLDELKREISSLARRLDGLESAQTAPGGVAVLEQRMEQLAITLTARVDAAKAEMASSVEAAGARSAHTVERIGHEVLRMADSLGRRVQGVENRSADAIEQVGGEVARVISTLEHRMQRSEGAQAQALEKLGVEIARISEKLTERIAHSERRAAQAIDDVGEQVTRTTERLNTRYDRASSDLAERIRQSEERTARLLEEAKERIDSRLADSQRKISEQVAEVAAAAPPVPLRPEAPAHAAVFAERATFADPFAAPAPPVIYPDAAPFGQTFAPHGFQAVEPEFERADMDAADDFAAVHTPETEADFIASPMEAALPEPEPEPAFLSPFRQEIQEEQESAFNPAQVDALTTRQMIEQARAAARNAAQASGKPQRASRGGGGEKKGGLPFLGRKKNNLKNALMMSAAALALGATLGGYLWTTGMFKGSLPDRVASNIVRGEGAEYKGPETDTSPMARAAMALDPTPIDGGTPGLVDPLPAAPNAMALYNEGVQKIETGDKSGVDGLQRAANLGLPAAQAYLGRLYEKGGSGLARNPAEARRWYERAAQAGDRSAMHNLGYYFFEGTAGPKNTTVAAEWFRRAAMLGLTDSQYNLGRLYEEGFGVSQNPAEAYKWYLLASRGGSGEQKAEARTAANRVGAKISDEARANAERTVQTISSQIAAQDRSAAGLKAASGLDVTAAQRALIKLGYYRGPADGQNTTALRLAVQAYQREKNLPATGLIDGVTLQSLKPYTG